MILPDVNVLLYAFRRDSPRHADFRRWLEALVNAQGAYGMAPQVLASVIRISTHARIFVQPSTLDEAIEFCRLLLTPDTCTIVHPGERHFYTMSVDGGARTKFTTMTGSNEATVSPGRP